MKKLLLILLLLSSLNIFADFTYHLEKGNIMAIQNKSNKILKITVYHNDYIIAPKMVKYITNRDDVGHDVDIEDKYLNFIEGDNLDKKLWVSPNIINIPYDCECGEGNEYNKDKQEIITNKFHPIIITVINYTLKDLVNLNIQEKQNFNNFKKYVSYAVIAIGIGLGFWFLILIIKYVGKFFINLSKNIQNRKVKIYEDKNYKI